MEKIRTYLISSISISVFFAFTLRSISDIFIFVFLGIAFASFIGLLYLNTQSEKKIASDYILETNEFIKSHNINADKTLFSDSGLSRIIFDHEKENLHILKSSSNPLSIPYSKIIESELMENGNTLTKTSRGSQIGGALIGGALAGGVGAIIGGLSGSKTSSESIKSLQIKIVIDDMTSPVHSFYIKDSVKTLTKDSPLYSQLYDNAYEVHKVLSVIIKKHDLQTTTN